MKIKKLKRHSTNSLGSSFFHLEIKESSTICGVHCVSGDKLKYYFKVKSGLLQVFKNCEYIYVIINSFFL